jgi:hypothetical protein
VTLDDQPLANAHVSFQPVAAAGATPGSGSFGITDADGRYTLRVVLEERDGAYVGHHRVEVVARAEAADDATDRPKAPPKPVVIPAKYNRDTGLSFDVKPGGTTEANFDLKSR